MRELSAAARPWSISDINYPAIELERVRGDRRLFYPAGVCLVYRKWLRWAS